MSGEKRVGLRDHGTRIAFPVLGCGCLSFIAAWGAFGNVASAAPPNIPIRLARSDDGLYWVDPGVVIFPTGDSPDMELGQNGELHVIARIEGSGDPNHPAIWAVSKSTDAGGTWSAPQSIVVRGARGREIQLQQADLFRTPGGVLGLFAVPTPATEEREDPITVGARKNVCVMSAESRNGVSFRARNRPVLEFDVSKNPHIVSAVFDGQIHLYADLGESGTRRRSSDRRLDHRISRDGRRFVSVRPSKIPADVTLGSIVETREGARMYASDGESVQSFVSKDGREWRRERGVRLPDARSPAVVRLRDGTYLMAYVSARENHDQPAQNEIVAIAGDSPRSKERGPTGEGPTLTVLPGLPAAVDEGVDETFEEPGETADGAIVQVDEPVAVVGSGAVGSESASTEARSKSPDAVDGAPGDDEMEEEEEEEEDEEEEGNVDDFGFAPRPDRQPDVDYVEWFQSQNSPGGEDNAAGDYEEISNDPRLQKPEEGEAPAFNDMFNSAYEGPPVAWDESDHPEWAESGKRVQDLLEKFQRASQRSEYAPPLRFDEPPSGDRGPLLMEMLLPDLPAHRTLTKATLADSWKKVNGRVQPDRMINAWRTVLRNANHFKTRTTLIENLISIAERNIVFKNSLWALKHEVLSTPEELREALEVLHSLGRDDYDPTSAARGEFAMAAQVTQYLFSPPGPDGKPLLNRRHVDELAEGLGGMVAEGVDAHEFLSSMTVADYYKSLNAFDHAYRELADQLRVGYPDVRADDADATQERYVHTTPLTELLMPSLSRVLVLRARSETTYRATQLVYAVHLFHADHGHWPRTLDELPRATSAEIRIDPFTGKDFGYRLEADGPVIYSFSENGEDDGGVHAPRWGDGEKDENASDDFVFWPVQGAP